MKKAITVCLVFVSLVLLNACEDRIESTDYFPLGVGLTWEYRHQTNTQGRSTHGTYTVTNYAKSKIDDENTTVRRTDDGRDYYLIRKPDGIYRYATRTLFETHPKKDNTPRMVLPIPYLDFPNTQWSASTTHYIIKRTGPSTISSANDTIEDFVMNYHVASIDETVEVPAGRFENCILVEGDATLTLFADPYTGFEDIPIKTREWYAPGIGLVKLERTEPLDTRVYKGGSYTFELTNFSD